MSKQKYNYVNYSMNQLMEFKLILNYNGKKIVNQEIEQVVRGLRGVYSIYFLVEELDRGVVCIQCNNCICKKPFVCRLRAAFKRRIHRKPKRQSILSRNDWKKLTENINMLRIYD